ncbi:hypothetical protein WJX84_001200 [Apatococcus fuscideae]|uniref:Uncharacterized protein n=1 Tax=Apatococcus fuscideae TaxID=2026836 RepID=A0AAW1TDD9_9CHLO
MQKQVRHPRRTPEPPATRESAIKQATDNVRVALGKSSKAKGFVGKTGRRLQVDIPLFDETSKAMAELCRDLLKSLPRDIAKQVSVGCADVDIALEASASLANHVFVLDDDMDPGQLSPILLLAAPSLDQDR